MCDKRYITSRQPLEVFLATLNLPIIPINPSFQKWTYSCWSLESFGWGAALKIIQKDALIILKAKKQGQWYGFFTTLKLTIYCNMVYCIIFVQRIHQKALLDWLCHRNIRFCQYWLFTINSYLSFLNIISIDLKVWGYPTLPIWWFINFNGWIMIENFVILCGKMKGID